MPKWTQEELDYLKDNYNTTRMEALQEYFGRSRSAVQTMARNIGVNKGRRKFNAMTVTKNKRRAKLPKQEMREGLKPYEELKPNECQYGYGEENVLFCGAPTANRVYCAEHMEVCTLKKNKDFS